MGLGRPTRQDAVAGFVTGLFSIPEGMAYASIGGFNPALGLYSGMLSTTVGSLFMRTVLMVTTLSSALALTSQSVLHQAGLQPTDPNNIATLTVLSGLVMLAFGLLRLGAAMSFVSNAVMTGFTTGIAVQIVAGVLGDATGYETTAHNTVRKVLDTVAHIGRWDLAATLVALGTVVAWFVVHSVRRLAPFAILGALVVVTAAVAVFGVDVKTVGDIAPVPRALPHPVLPDLSTVPDLAVGAVAVALVALAQSAGVGTAIPNPDGSRPHVSGDFTAQGLANIAGGLFRALPAGGSMSRTSVAASAGAQTRWSGVFAGIFLALLVLVAGPLAEEIPMAVIGGLLLVIGGELIEGRVGDVRLVWSTGWMPTAAMLVTFVATTQVPLQDAILLGAGLSLLLYCVNAERSASLQAIVRDRNGRWSISRLPSAVPSDSVTVLHYEGVSLFAEVAKLDETWPSAADAHHAVVILHVRTAPDVPSSTILKALRRRARELTTRDCRLMVVGLDPHLVDVLVRTGVIDQLGPENVIAGTPTFFQALDSAYDEATAWVRSQQGDAAREEEDG